MAGIVGLFAVAWGEMVVLLWASAIAAIAVASTLWARSALRGVSVEVAFEPARAFVGEDVTLGPGAKLIFPDDGNGTLKAHDLTLQGSVQGKGLGITIMLTGNLRTESRGRIWAGVSGR